MSSFIDIHCHLDFEGLYEQLEGVVSRARDAGVRVMVTAGVDYDTNRKVLEMSAKYEEVKAALGWYPPDAWHKESSDGSEFVFDWKKFEEELSFIRSHADKIVGIGEVGMDFKDGKDREMQLKVFGAFIDLSLELDKALVIHSRKAEEDVLTLLEEKNAKKVLMHCFGGKKRLIRKGVELGYSFSIPTNVVRSEQTQMLCDMVPLDQLFAETDAPFLSPFRDQRNEPAFVVEGYKKIAEIKKMTLEDLKNQVFMNYQRLFM